jgi:hypothetical protein
MNKLVVYLESKDVVFHATIILIVLYVPHAGHLFKQLEHLDMTIFGTSILNWLYAIALAAVIEFIILVLIVNGYRNTGKFYALISFFLNAFYYDYWFIAIQEQSMKNIKLSAISFIICLIHSFSIWQLSELFYKRIQADKIEHWCPECDAGPFPNKRSLDGHVSKAHRPTKQNGLKNNSYERKLNGIHYPNS